jgi:hypothetical protein
MSKYSRRHYQDVAREIAMEYEDTKDFGWIRRGRKVTRNDVYVRTMKIDTLRNLVSKFDVIFRLDNERYNSDLFIKACGIEEMQR